MGPVVARGCRDFMKKTTEMKRRMAFAALESPELQSARRELQEEAIVLALPSLYIAGIGLVLLASVFQTALHGAVLGLALLGGVGAVWMLRRTGYWAAAWLLVVCVFVATLLAVIWADSAPALGLLALPVGLATLLIGIPVGMVAAIGTSILCFWMPPVLLVVEPAEQTSAVLMVWGVLWLVWLNSRSMLTVMTWFRMSYEQSRDLLEEARDRQLQLSQSLQDLAEANLQLSRLHRFANSMRQLAEDARRAKEQFVANVSHELRTLLNMIIGFTEMILQAPHTYGYNVPQALLADLEIVQRNGQHLSNLINDVLDLSHIETGQMALTKELVTLEEIVDAAVTAVKPLYDSKGLNLEVALPEMLPPLFCDPLRIRQVLLNLLT